MTALLSAEHLSRQYASHRGVRDFSMALGTGDLVGLAGLNGAGKSTTLAMLAGVLRPTGGRVLVRGRDVFGDVHARRELGFAPDSPPVYPELTVREYLGYAAALHGLERKEIDRATDRVLEDWQLRDSADRLIRALSHGFRQRVGLAQACIHRPAVLLLDEPTEGLDPQQVGHFRRLMTRHAATGAALVSTHQLDFIAGLCNRLLVLHEGRIVREQPLRGESAAELREIFRSTTGAEAA